MLTLLQNIICYSPQYAGLQDILIAGETIERIGPPGRIPKTELIDRVIPCEELLAFPGLIDQHVHITGAGGEQGFASRTPEIAVDELFEAGVTTLVGLLGADGTTRSMENLFAKAAALQTQGVTTYLYSGSYALPPVTLTGDVTRDLILVDKVIGAGEIAISDHRSSQPALRDLLKTASQVHRGGLIGGKAGVLHLHVGDGKDGLRLLREIRRESELPPEMFVPTHINRNRLLFAQGESYCIEGGHIDLTAGESAGIPVPEALRLLADAGADLTLITVSSDANGSIPGGGVAKIQALYDDIIRCIREKAFKPGDAFRFVTENVAKTLKLYPKKGCLCEGADADILITNKNYQIQKLFSKGTLRMDNGCVLNQ